MNIKAENVSMSFGEKEVIKNLSLEFEEGKTTVIMGESGKGKTTLINLIMGIFQPTKGKITGVPEKIAAVFQEDRLIEGYSTEANIKLVSGIKTEKNKITEILKPLELENSIDTDVSTLSGGMRRRVAIARALITDFDLLILDEPFKGLDEALKETVMSFVKEKSAGKTVIMVTHDESEAEFLGAKVIRI